MGDNWVIDWLEEQGAEKGGIEGREEGRAQEARYALLRVIERRFGEVPADLRAQVESVTGLERLERLEWLHGEAVTCVSLAKLSELLDRA